MFKDLITHRQSTRRYSNKLVDRALIEQCVEAARLAPSACNSQPWKFIVVDEPTLKHQVARLTFDPLIAFNKFATQAPVMIVMTMEKPKTIAQIGGRIKDKDFYLMDIGIAAEHFCLQADELGLGTCMLGWFKEKKIQDLLEIPTNKRIGLLITLGYPHSDKIRKKKRKELKEIISFNQYKNG